VSMQHSVCEVAMATAAAAVAVQMPRVAHDVLSSSVAAAAGV
jgi:hypothetical protein